ncbi:hypothetical protein KHU50_004970 [Colletotrichum sp. SAR 10_65]|nr:hypothetical protein KHU50_004970 [Colletotrichum sp. SAR 10_65]
MKYAIASLYAHILLFLKQALKWYNVSPASRILKSLFKPFELSYRETVDQIKLCAQTINDIANLAVKSEVREMNMQLQQQSSYVEGLEKRLCEMQEGFRMAQAELTEMVRSVLQIASRDTIKLSAMHIDIGEIKPRVLDIHFSHILDVNPSAGRPYSEHYRAPSDRWKLGLFAEFILARATNST